MDAAAEHRHQPIESALGVAGWRVIEKQPQLIVTPGEERTNRWKVADILLGCVVMVQAPVTASNDHVRALVTASMYKMVRDRMIELVTQAALAAQPQIQQLQVEGGKTQ